MEQEHKGGARTCKHESLVKKAFKKVSERQTKSAESAAGMDPEQMSLGPRLPATCLVKQVGGHLESREAHGRGGRELTALKSAQHAVPCDGAKGPTVRRGASPPRWMLAGDAAHVQEPASTQSDFSSLDMSVDVGQQGRMDAAETSMCASECMMAETGASSTCSDAHASVALAQDAHDVLLGKLCNLRVADFPVDSNGLAMWPRADLPLGRRRSCKHSNKPAKRTCPESDSDSDSGDEELNEEGGFFWCVKQQRRIKKSRTS